MSKRFIGLSILACAVLASSLLANGPDTPPTAEDVYGLKTWIEENVTAADVSAEIEGAVSAHAVDTSTHGVSTVADAADVSAHVASAGTAVHGLGTMAVEAKTDYVATGTFTGHTGDKANPHEVTYTQTGALASSAKAVDADKLDGLNSTDFTATGTFTAHTDDSSDPHGATLTQTTIVSDSVDGVDISAHVASAGVHGVAQVAGIADVNNALSAANASDALLLPLDGSRAMTGNLKFAGGYGILRATSDNTDNSYLWLSGGGDLSPDRGGCMSFFGNEYSGAGGQVRYFAGNVSTGDHIFYTGASAERMRIKYSGNLLIGTTTDDGVNKLQVNGSVAISSFMQLASPTAIPTAAAGRIYFNGTESKFKKCTDGSNWVDM